MISRRFKWIIALLVVAGLVIVAQASLQGETYLPLAYNSAATVSPTSTRTPTLAFSPTNTATRTHTPTSTNTATSSPTPTITGGPYPTPQVNTMVEVELDGPASIGMGTPNPFLIEVEVTFSGPQGQSFIVPGFYDGDGAGGMDGSIWKRRIIEIPFLGNKIKSVNNKELKKCE